MNMATDDADVLSIIRGCMISSMIDGINRHKCDTTFSFFEHQMIILPLTYVRALVLT